MLRFPEQDRFEAWLRACPLGQRNLTYGVSRSGDEGILAVSCAWRAPAVWTQAARPAAHGLDASPSKAAGVEEEASRAKAAGGAGGNAAEIAELRSNLERMQGMMSRPPRGGSSGPAGMPATCGDPLAAKMAAMTGHVSSTAGGEAQATTARGEAAPATMPQASQSGASTRSGPTPEQSQDEKARGEAALTTMLQASQTGASTQSGASTREQVYDEKARGEAALAAMLQARQSGASTREQVRACLSVSLGGSAFPKPPGGQAFEECTEEAKGKRLEEDAKAESGVEENSGGGSSGSGERRSS